MRIIPIVLTCLLALASTAAAERIKDIVEVQGVRSNPLIGYGVVVGLNGTGDGSPASQRAMASALRRMGIVLAPIELASKNVASVMVTADLPPFGRAGSTIDVMVSAIGNSTSLQGGTLLMTELKGADGQTYAVSQGPLSVGGFSATGESGSVSKNHPTAGRIPAGATIEREEPATFINQGRLCLELRNPDFSTAEKIAVAVNEAFPASSVAVDAGTISVQLPPKLARADVAAFVDRIGQLEVRVDQSAVVVINERTGTIVVGENVGISTVAISHGNLSIITQEKDFVSQPNAFSETGKTEKTHRTDITAIEERGTMNVIGKRTSVAELARALNAMGLTPRDLISIFQALRQAGALQAELRII